MALKDDIALLAATPAFSDLEEEHLRLLAFGAERRRLDDGQTLFAEGSTADCAFVVASGGLALSVIGRDGKPVDRGTAGPGTMLSELGLIVPAARQSTAQAIGETEVLRITRALFFRMVEEYPDVGRRTEERLRARFSDMAGALGAILGRL